MSNNDRLIPIYSAAAARTAAPPTQSFLASPQVHRSQIDAVARMCVCWCSRRLGGCERSGWYNVISSFRFWYLSLMRHDVRMHNITPQLPQQHPNLYRHLGYCAEGIPLPRLLCRRSYGTYRSSGYGYGCLAELAEVPGTRMKPLQNSQTSRVLISGYIQRSNIYIRGSRREATRQT